MEENIYTSSGKYKKAATDGLTLASITIIYTLIITFVKVPVLDSVLWFFKFAGSIWLLFKMMKKYGTITKDESTFGYGVLVCLFSSIVCAIYQFFHWSVVAPGEVTILFDNMLEVMNSTSSMTDEIREMLLGMEDNYAQLSCLIGFFYYTIFGIIVSAILKRGTTVPRDIFSDTFDQPQNQNSDDDE